MSRPRSSRPRGGPESEANAARAAAAHPLDERVRTASLVVLATVAAGAALHWLAPVLVPFLLALFLAIALAPLVDRLGDEMNVGRGVAVALAMALGIALLLATLGVVTVSVQQLAAQKEAYVAELTAWHGDLQGLVARLGERWPEAVGSLSGSVQGALEGWRAHATSLLSAILSALGNLASQGLSVSLFLVFLLLEQRRPKGGVAGLLDRRIKGYVAVKVVASLATGILTSLALGVLGVDAALLFGLLAFFLNFIPAIGSVVAVMLPLPIVLAEGHGPLTIALALVVPMAIQFVIGQIWENKKLGHEFDLRGSVVLLALVLWGKLFGLVGMFLATPLTAVLKALLADWPLTAPVARAMGAPEPEPEAGGARDA